MRLVAAFLLGLLGAGLLPGSALAQAAPADRISMRFDKADLARILRTVGPQLGERFLFETTLSGRVTIAVPQPVSRAEAWDLLHAALALKGFAAVPLASGGYKIVPVAEAGSADPWILAAPAPEGESRVVTLLRIKNVSLDAIVAPLTVLQDPATVLIPLIASNALVIGTTQRRLASIIDLIDQLDREWSGELVFRTLRHADAAGAASILDAQYGGAEGAHRAVEAWADARTNTLIYRADPVRRLDVEDLLAALDAPSAGSGRIEILPIRFADAEAVAEQLRQLAAPSGPQGARAEGLSGQALNIAVDGPTHSLVIEASPEALAMAREVVDRLDRSPRQVAIDVLIADLRFDEGLDLAIDARVPLTNPKRPEDLIVTADLLPSGDLAQFAGPQTGSTLARFGRAPLVIPTTGAPIMVVREGVLTADARTVHADSIMNPHILAINGEEHRLFSGANIPIPTAQTSDEGSDPFRNETAIERRDTGVDLRVRPTIGSEGHVVLEIDLQISDVTDSLSGSVEEVGVTLIEQRVQATARLRDGEVVLIATQEEPRFERTSTGVPFLKDLPLIGFAFRATTRTEQRRRFLIAARARVLAGPEETAAYSVHQRLAFERATARAAAIDVPEGAAWTLRVGTETTREAARSLAERLDSELHPARVVEWEAAGEALRFDVHLLGFESFASAADEALRLYADGYVADVFMAANPLRLDPQGR